MQIKPWFSLKDILFTSICGEIAENIEHQGEWSLFNIQATYTEISTYNDVKSVWKI